MSRLAWTGALCWALASGLCGPAAGQDRAAAPSERTLAGRQQAAWGALSAGERQDMLRLLGQAPDRARAEAEFVEVGWRLYQLRELQRTAPLLEPWRLEEKQRALGARVGRSLAAVASQRRDAFLQVLGPSLQAAGYSPEPAAAARPSAPAKARPPEPAPEPRPQTASRSLIPGTLPADYVAAVRLSQQALRRRDWRAAESAARRAMGLAPQELWAYALKALALSMQGRDQEAAAEIRTAVLIKPKAAGLKSVHAFILNRARRFREAERSVDSSLEGRPQSAWAWYQLAYSQAGLGDREASLRSLEQAARMDAAGYEARRRRALAATGEQALLELFVADPAIDTAPFAVRQPRRWPSVKLLPWPTVLAGVLIVLFLLHKDIAAWVVRLGLAHGGTPLPAAAPTPLTGLPAAAPSAPGAPLAGLPAGYRVVRQIGTGGMGAVFEALDLSLQRRVAIKRMRDEIRSDPRERERFLKEARTVARMRHPCIVDIHAIVEAAGEVFLVFEYLDGKTLDLAIYESGRLGLRETRAVLGQICSALDYAHAHGVIHRDLKPANIMLTREHRVKVMDFGVARQAQDALSRLSLATAAAGTPPYMAPESETGAVRVESDLYSLAVLLYEMLSGARPFDGTNAGMLYSKMNMRFERITAKAGDLPPALDDFFALALHCEPEKRQRSASAFLAAFEAAAGLAPKP